MVPGVELELGVDEVPGDVLFVELPVVEPLTVEAMGVTVPNFTPELDKSSKSPVLIVGKRTFSAAGSTWLLDSKALMVETSGFFPPFQAVDNWVVSDGLAATVVLGLELVFVLDDELGAVLVAVDVAGVDADAAADAAAGVDVGDAA